MNDLLPAPRVPELSPARHAALRTAMLAELEPARARRSRRWPVLAAPAVAVAAAVAVIVLAGGGGGAKVAPPAPSTATHALEQAAFAAGQRAPLAPRADQFEYIRTIGAYTAPTAAQTMDGPRRLGPITTRSVWLPQHAIPLDGNGGGIVLDGKPQQRYDQGLIRSGGNDTRIVAAEPHQTPTYAQMAAYPTDPAAALAKVRAGLGGSDSPGAEFDAIGGLLSEAIVPPDVTAALYRAAARIPGVTLVADSVDAAGRHGFAVALVADGERTEWIFDPKTDLYLGERAVRVADGTLTATSAVLQRGVADRAGAPPLRSDAEVAPA